jgi:ATP/maltotriose-dependent transcriptional regulator MalT
MDSREGIAGCVVFPFTTDYLIDEVLNSQSEGIREFIREEDMEFAANTIEDHLSMLFDRNDMAGARRWLYALPTRILARRPLLRLHECSLKLVAREISQVLPILAGIEIDPAHTLTSFDDYKRTDFLDTLTYVKHTLPYYEDPATADIGFMREGLQKVLPAGRAFYDAIEIFTASSLLNQGEVGHTEEILREAATRIFSPASVAEREGNALVQVHGRHAAVARAPDRL